YFLGMRDKRRAAALLDYAAMTPVLHVSGRFPAARRCAALILPIAPHPSIGNRVLAFDLDADPTPLIELDPDAIADRLYTPAADLPEGETRVALKEVHLNRCPALVERRHLGAADIARLGLDLDRAERHAERLRACPGLAGKVRQVYGRRAERGASDPDQSLYDGFPG